MWHVNFPCGEILDEIKVNSVMPRGYRAEKESFDRYEVYTTEPRRLVGACTVIYGGVTISFDNDIDEGLSFAAAWALIHPGYDPKQVLFGFVYQSPDGSFQLDKMPEALRSVALEQIGNYDSSENTFMVSFRRGEWDLQFINALTMRPVLKFGELGEEVGPMLLHLGNIENSSTM